MINSITPQALAAPIMLVTTAHPSLYEHPGPSGESVHPMLGRLVQPRHTSSVADTAAAGIPWAADNDCFQGLDAAAFTRMIDRLAGHPGCLFVTVPDVVADAAATARQFERWAPELERRGLPVALVLQDGIDSPELAAWLDRTWDRLAAVFIGGSDDFKLGPVAAELAREAKRRGKWVHWGRVNTRKRIDYIADTGAADSFDGSSWAIFRKAIVSKRTGERKLDQGLRWCMETLARSLRSVQPVVAPGRVLAPVAGGSPELDAARPAPRSNTATLRSGGTRMMVTTEHLTLVPLARVSRLKGRSPELAERDYRERLERWGQSQPTVTMLAFRCDVDRTGGTVKGRDQLESALRDIAAGDADGIVVPEAKRFGRNLRETVNLIYALREGGTVKIGRDEIELPGGALFLPLDVPGAENPSDRNSKLALHLWLSIAEHELDGYKEQWLERKTRWAEAGAHIGPAPRGYRHREHPDGEDPVGLEPDDDAPTIPEAFRILCADGLGPAAAYLGLPPTKALGTDAKPGILRNEVYLGRTSWEHPTRGAIVVHDAHTGLVEPGVFWRAQAILNGDVVARRSPKADYPLSGSGSCGRCGSALSGSLARQNRTYRCASARSPKTTCGPFSRVNADALADRLRELLVGRAEELLAEGYEDHGAPVVTRGQVRAELAERATGADIAREDLPDDERVRQAQQRRDDVAQRLAKLDPDNPVFTENPGLYGDALKRAQEDLATAQEALDKAVADVERTPGPPTPEEVAAATDDQLGQLCERLAVTFVVGPDRAPIADRVTLQPVT
jgi:DNA invertase Pin-like site-specific DNA recombinase